MSMSHDRCNPPENTGGTGGVSNNYPRRVSSSAGGSCRYSRDSTSSISIRTRNAASFSDAASYSDVKPNSKCNCKPKSDGFANASATGYCDSSVSDLLHVDSCSESCPHRIGNTPTTHRDPHTATNSSSATCSDLSTRVRRSRRGDTIDHVLHISTPTACSVLQSGLTRRAYGSLCMGPGV